jgi:hypothetical protein
MPGGYGYTTLSGIQPAVADVDRFVTVANGVMKNSAYTLTATLTQPEANTARLITITHATVAAGTDNPLGTVTIVGTNLAGQSITEVCVPVADATTTYTKWFATVVSVTGAGWTAVGGSDTITVGCAANAIIAEGSGVLHGIQINTTAAGTITVSDSVGTIAVLPASVAVGTFYLWDVAWTGYLRIVMAAASNITVLHSGSRNLVYST